MTSSDARERAREERRVLLIEAAVRVLDRDGRDALSMRNLASESGLSPMAAYQYFESQQALAVAVWRYVIVDYTRRMIDLALPLLDDPGVAYLEIIRGSMLFADEFPHRFEYIFNDPIVHVVRELPAMLGPRTELYLFGRELISRARATGTYRSDIGIDELQLATMAMMQGLGNQIVMQRSTRFFGISLNEMVEIGLRFVRECVIAR